MDCTLFPGRVRVTHLRVSPPRPIWLAEGLQIGAASALEATVEVAMRSVK
jgi:hypothetical protein